MPGPSAGRLVFASAVTPLVPPLAVAALAYVAEGFPAGALGLLGLLGLYLAFALPIGVPAVLVLLITFIALRRCRWERWWTLGLAGSLIGWLCVFLMAWVFEDPPAANVAAVLSKAISKDALLMTASGGTAGCVFWFLVHAARRQLAGAAFVLLAWLGVLAGSGALLGRP